jgi:uncharacterized phage protein (predicted DNA packaging)
MAILDDIKIVLRVTHTMTDSEIIDLISAARQDLILSGVVALKAEDDTDALIKRAITMYVKWQYGWDNPDAARWEQAYHALKMHLTLAGDYNDVS